MGFSWGGEDSATWGGSDGALWGSTPEGAYARLVNAAGSERVIQPSTVVGGDAAREHSALSDYQLTVPYDESIEDWRFSTIYLYDQGEFLFVGELLSIESDEARATTTLSGPGIGVTLERGDAVKTYQRVTIPNAIRDYLSTDSPIGGTVTDPTTTSITGSRILEEDTQDGLAKIFTPEETQPFEVSGGKLRVLQSGNTLDTTADYSDRNISNTPLGDEYNSGGTSQLVAAEEYLEFEVSFPYDIPASRVGWFVRDETNASSDISFYFSGVEIDRNVGDSFPLDWREISAGFYGGDGYEAGVGGTLSAGETYTVRIEANASSDYSVDVVAVHDTQFGYSFPNPDAATNGGGSLSGPELYPDGAPIQASVASASHRVNSVSVTASIDDTTDGQALAWSADGGKTWHETANTETITNEAVAEDTSRILVRVKLGRYGTQTTIPTSGVTGQTLSSLSIDVDGDTMPVAEDLTVDGNHLENLQRLHKRGNMRFVIGHAEDEDDWTIESFRRGDVAGTSDWVVENATRKRAVAEYANRIVGKGAKDENGDRIRVAETDTAEVTRLANDLGISEADATITRTFTDPSIENLGDLGVAVRSQLNHATGEDQNTGKLDVFPVLLDPGKTHTVDQWDGDEFDLERVVYRFGAGGQASGTLVFEEPEGLGEAISDTRQRTGEIRDSV